MTGRLADWLPPAVVEGPAGASDTERLLDLVLAAVDEQVSLLARDIDQVHDDFFIESCREWAVPYIGALLGLPDDATRLEVANTIALRRRKGTPAALEDFAEVITAWTARVIDGWQIIACAHKLDHPLGPRPTVFSFDRVSLARAGGPFDASQRVASPGLGVVPDGAQLFVWPHTVHTHVATEMAPIGGARFALHPCGSESPMYLRPRPLTISRAPDQGRTVDESDAPIRVTYRVLEALAAPGDITVSTNWTIGSAHPLADVDPLRTPPLIRLSAVHAGTGARTDVPWDRLRFGALPPGVPAPQAPAGDEVVVDVHRGLVEIGPSWTGPVRATWHRAVSGELGALPATATVDQSARVVVTVNPDATPGPTVAATLAGAIARAKTLSAGLDPAGGSPDHPDVEIRLFTGARLAAPPAGALSGPVVLPRWRIVAPELLTPTIVGDLTVDLESACVLLEGFQITGSILVGPTLDGLGMQNLTMDPTAAASIRVDPAAWGLDLAADRSILAPIRADLGSRPIRLTNCVVDGLGAQLVACGSSPPVAAPVPAIQPTGPFPPTLSAQGVTFVGPVELDSIDATDCIFADGLEVIQTQLGCLRFCYIGDSPSGRLPVTHQCLRQPRPWFESVQFESPDYFTLPLDRPTPLLTAGSTGGALGAYGHVGAGVRIARLRRRIGEFVPLGVKPRIIVAKGETS